MMSFWQSRTSRERLLLIVAAVVATVVLAVQFALLPMLDRRETAALTKAQTESTLVRLQRLKAAGAVYRPAIAERPITDSGLLASQWATGLGLTFQQDPATATGLRFTFSSADPATIFAWIERIEGELGLSVSSAELASSERGLVQATIVVSAGKAP